MRTTNFRLIALAWLTLLVVSVSAQSRIRVNNTGVAAPFTNLTLAITAATPGDTIIVENSDISYGSIIVDKDLVIYGTGFFLEDNDTTHADIRNSTIDDLIVTSTTAEVRIAGLQMTNVSLNGIKTILERCHITGSITMGDLSPANSVILKKNFIDGAEPRLIDIQSGVGIVIANNFIQNSASASDYIIRMAAGSGVLLNNVIFGDPKLELRNMTVQNNYFHDAQIDNIASSGLVVDHNAANTSFLSFYGDPSNLDLSLEPFAAAMPDTLFKFNLTTSRDAKFELNPWPTNRLRAAGTGGVDIGFFGGVDPYVKSGMPPIPAIFEFTAPSSGTAGAGLDVNVKVKAHK